MLCRQFSGSRKFSSPNQHLWWKNRPSQICKTLYETLKQTSCSPSSDDIQCEVSNWPTHIAAHLQVHKTPTQSQPAKELQFLPPHCKHSYCWRKKFSLSSPLMKFLFFILSLFMLYLSCLPCGDSTECNVKAPTEISATDNHQQHNHEAETCTPFCTCTCCAASAFYSANSKVQSVKSFSSEKHPLYNVAFNTEAHYSIFQPPKLS